MNRIFIIFISLLMFYMSYKIVFIRVFSQRWMVVDLSSPILFIPLGILFFGTGAVILYSALSDKMSLVKQEKFNKCPKCKKVFNYNELEDGKCKYCKDVETIEIEEYYKKYPKELEEK